MQCKHWKDWKFQLKCKYCKCTLLIALSYSLSLQEVGPNSSWDVRGLCQQETGAWTPPPIHPTTLDYGAASILWHSDEEPGAQWAALTSHPGGHTFCVIAFCLRFSVRTLNEQSVLAMNSLQGASSVPQDSCREPKHKPGNRKRLQLVKDFIFVQSEPQCGLCVY